MKKLAINFDEEMLEDLKYINKERRHGNLSTAMRFTLQLGIDATLKKYPKPTGETLPRC